MFNRYTVVIAISLCSLGSVANAANPLTDYPKAKPGDAGYVAEDPQLAHLAGMPGPSITLRSVEGGTIDIVKNYGHKPVYLKLWASYCIPCRAQMPGFEEIYVAYGNRMQIIAVNAGVGVTILRESDHSRARRRCACRSRSTMERWVPGSKWIPRQLAY